MDDRVAALEREYQEKRASTPSGTSGKKATTSLRDEVKSDMDDVKEAVSRLRTTTAENWWDRHESALETAIGDVEKDVRRFTGTPAAPARPKDLRTTDESGQPVSTAPFTSRRDKFVADMQTRLDAMGKSLDAAKATGREKPPAPSDRTRRSACSRGEVDRRPQATRIGISRGLVGCVQGAG